MSLEAIVIGVITVVIAAVWLLWRFARGSSAPAGQMASELSVETVVREEFPSEGLLVSEEVLRSAGSNSATVWEALEAAVVPVAIEYHPVSEAEIVSLRTVPVNASAQQAVVQLVKTIGPKGPTLFRAVLPKGAELVKAVGESGFRGFSRSGGKTAHALLKPVAVGGAVVAGWPVFAVAATVTAVDMAAQRELRAHQRRVESLLGRQEERHYIERIKNQKSADSQLTRAISMMLDGQNPSLELARKSADDEFYVSQQFLGKHSGIIGKVVDSDGKVDYRRLEELLGGKEKDVENFVRDLHLARGAIAIQRKAIIADAAGRALADPTNPYSALRTFIDAQVRELEEADAAEAELTQSLTSIELKGRWYDDLMSRWYDSDNAVAARQERLRAQMARPQVEDISEVRYLLTSSGEILQVLPSDEEAAQEPEPDE